MSLPVNVTCYHTGVQGENWEVLAARYCICLYQTVCLCHILLSHLVKMTPFWWLDYTAVGCDSHCYRDIQFVFDWFAFCSYSTLGQFSERRTFGSSWVGCFTDCMPPSKSVIALDYTFSVVLLLLLGEPEGINQFAKPVSGLLLDSAELQVQRPNHKTTEPPYLLTFSFGNRPTPFSGWRS